MTIFDISAKHIHVNLFKDELNTHYDYAFVKVLHNIYGVRDRMKENLKYLMKII